MTIRPSDELARPLPTGCVTEDELEDFCRKKLQPETEERTAEHFAGCDFCFARFEAHMRFVAALSAAASQERRTGILQLETEQPRTGNRTGATE